MKTTYTIEETTKEIKERLPNISGSSYFWFELDGEEIKVRVSDHSARHRNNGFDEKVLSFCTNFVKHSDSNPMTNEWIVDEDGYCDDYGQYIEDILDFELN